MDGIPTTNIIFYTNRLLLLPKIVLCVEILVADLIQTLLKKSLCSENQRGGDLLTRPLIRNKIINVN